MSTGLTKLARAGVVDSHRTLADRAFAALHDSIVAGHLAPGERLPIEELGVALGMSAMPIREALRRPAQRFGADQAALATSRLEVLNELPDDNSPETWAAHTAFHFALYEAA